MRSKVRNMVNFFTSYFCADFEMIKTFRTSVTCSYVGGRGHINRENMRIEYISKFQG